MKVRTWALRMGALAIGVFYATAARADWIINGVVQTNIPFWYTLKEAIEAYYGLM